MAVGPTATVASEGIDEGTAAANSGQTREWPSSGAAYWGLTVIILATFLSFFDQVTFGMLAERIKHDFGLTDSQLGFLAGPATIICYVFVGIPLARLADIYPRKFVLSAGVAVTGAIMALGGIAQNFVQFVGSRVFLAAGGSAHAPSSYSLLADAFPPRKLTRAFALLQFGFIGGTTLGPMIGGRLVLMTKDWEPSQLAGLTILGWQWILIWLAIPSFVVALLFLTVREPKRLMPATGADTLQPPSDASPLRRVVTFMGWDAVRAIMARKHVYLPLFGALALSAVDSFGLQFWRTPFMVRTYGWNEKEVGDALGLIGLVASLSGLVLGGAMVEFLARKHKDANVRAATICFAVVSTCAIIAPTMPNGWAALIVMGVGLMFGIAGAVPQNAAIQRIAPNAMRGQVTAIYLFMFTFFGAAGSYVVGLVQDYVVGSDALLWKSLVITAVALLPLATFLMYSAMKPYRQEVARLEAAGQ